MKKIKIIENKNDFILNFATPNTELDEISLSKLMGGATCCNCRKEPLIHCGCYGPEHNTFVPTP
ncbi:MAG: hypothetical protein KAT68_09085 [Bacteroidales bacterium]|nr:hypothetical protein [Bacteroidales bacterium]